jgi:hypothetical protein
MCSLCSQAKGKVLLFWGITAEGCVAFSDDINMLKGSCDKSLAPFPQGKLCLDDQTIKSNNYFVCFFCEKRIDENAPTIYPTAWQEKIGTRICSV